MKTVQSRVYTNVILTVIAVFLGMLALKPVVQFATEAQARDRFGEEPYTPLSERVMSGTEERLQARENVQQARVLSDLGGEMQAEATRDVAAATRELALATREMAEAQREIAQSIAQLGSM